MNKYKIAQQGGLSTTTQRPLNPFQITKNRNVQNQSNWDNSRPVLKTDKPLSPAARKAITDQQEKDKLIQYADVATDVMQMGNFVPHPAAQAVGKLGNVLGPIVDGYQGYSAYNEGNYTDAGINMASAVLPFGLEKAKGIRNTKYLNPSIPRTQYMPLDKPYRSVSPLQLQANRGLAGILTGETMYDLKQQGGSAGKLSKYLPDDYAQQGSGNPLTLPFRQWLADNLDPKGNDMGSSSLREQWRNYREGVPIRPSVDDEFLNKYLELPYNERYVQKSPHKPTIVKKHKTTPYYRLAPDYVDWDALKMEAETIPVGESRKSMFRTNSDNPGLEIADPIQRAIIGHGKDEKGHYVSYYDIYDLASNPLEGIIGEPYELYDRHYFIPSKKDKPKPINYKAIPKPTTTKPVSLKQQGGSVGRLFKYI